MNLKDFPRGDGITPMQSGTYNAVCCGLIDLGVQYFEYMGIGQRKSQLLLVFEFPDEQIEVDGELLPRNLSQKFNKSCNEKSNFRKTLTSWRGRDFSDDELNDFDLSRLVGVPATVSVSTKESGGKTVSYISAITKPMRDNKNVPSRKILFDLSNNSTFDSVSMMTNWMIDLINRSEEAVKNGWKFDKNETEHSAVDVNVSAHESEDDIPF